VVHPFGPGVLSEIRVAATVPVVFAGPVADTHSPTFSAAAVAAVVAVTMVALVAVMVSVVVAWVVRLVVWMTIVAPDTETTFPVAKVPNWARVDPGVFPVGARDGLADPAGRVRVGDYRIVYSIDDEAHRIRADVDDRDAGSALARPLHRAFPL